MERKHSADHNPVIAAFVDGVCGAADRGGTALQPRSAIPLQKGKRRRSRVDQPPAKYVERSCCSCLRILTVKPPAA